MMNKIIKTTPYMLRYGFVFIFLILFGLQAKASHIVGGELNYRCIGVRQFEITLTVYLDCENNLPGATFDDPAWIGIFDGLGNLQTSEGVAGVLQIPVPTSDTLRETLESACFVEGSPVCVERAQYKDTITLTQNPNGYILVYQRCCRNETILNIDAPDETGAAYYCYIPPSTFEDEPLQCNNGNPVFNDWPPIFICAGDPIDFDHSATDPDGDEIVYKLCDPSTALAIDRNRVRAPEQFDEPDGLNEPFPLVDFIPPYSLNNMLGGADPLTIDPNTGFLTGIPRTIGQFVVGICAEEYRDGVLLSETRRDFQFNVRACGEQPMAEFELPESSCESLEVFLEATGTFDFIQWILPDGVSDVNPLTYTFPEPGTYDVTLVAYTDSLCTDSLTRTIIVDNLNGDDIVDIELLDPCAGLEELCATIDNPDDFTFKWSESEDFSDTLSTEACLDLTLITGNGPIYVMATKISNGCPIMDVVGIDDTAFEVDFMTDGSECDSTVVTFIAEITPRFDSLIWEFGDASTDMDTSTQLQPTYTYPSFGIYPVSLTVYNGICTSTVVKDVAVFSEDIIDLDDLISCFDDPISLNEDGDDRFTYSWPTIPSDETNPTVVVGDDTAYPVVITAAGSNCTFNDTVFVASETVPMLPDPFVVCGGDSITLNEGGSTDLSYVWGPAELFGDQVNAVSPRILITEATTITLMVTDGRLEDCTRELSVEVTLEEGLAYSIPDTVGQCGVDGTLTITAMDMDDRTLIFTWVDDNGEVIFVGNPLETTIDRDQVITVIITAEGSNCSDTTEVFATIEDLTVMLELESDGIYCQGDTVRVFVTNEDIPDGSTITWEPGFDTEGPELEFVATGPVTVVATVTTPGMCQFDGMIDVPVDDLAVSISGPDCVDDPETVIQLMANVNQEDVEFLWERLTDGPDVSEDDIANPTITGATTTTQYRLTVTNDLGCMIDVVYQIPFQDDCGGGNGNDSCMYQIAAVAQPPCVMDADTEVQFGIQVSDPDVVFETISWTALDAGAPALSDPTIATPTAIGFTATVSYMVTTVDTEGCEKSANVTVTFQEDCTPNCENQIMVPNVFTPNGDTMDDELVVTDNTAGADIDEFIIFDRWGNQVFSTNSLSIFWNGMDGSRQVQQDVYGYYITGTCPDGEPLMKTGNITVLR